MIKVLIVEDDPMVALINKRYLQDIGDIQVYGPVMTQEEIIEVLDSEKINLILLDVYLPKKNGIEILKCLRNRKYLEDVIMITAANSVEEVKKAFSYGIVDYLVKPFDYERLEAAINKYKMKATLLNKTGNINQKDIDKLFNKDKKQIQTELPKGLNCRTLDVLCEFLNNNSDKVWTLREIANEINISNVTIKKYMDYLESINKIKGDLTSGNVGRPEIKYSIISEK